MLEKKKELNLEPRYQEVLDFLNFNNDCWAQRSEKSRLSVIERQEPKFIIIACSDSRTAPEQIFCINNPGEVFVIRLAGPTLPKEAIGTIEWAVTNLNNPQQVNIPLIIVLGHDDCGAVKATLQVLRNNIPTPTPIIDNNIQALIDGVRLGLRPVHEYSNDRSGVNEAVQDHIIELVKQLNEVNILKDHVNQNKLKIVGAFYSFDTGKVRFL